MHPYSTDSKEREQVLLALAALAIVMAFGLSLSLQAAQLTVPWWLDAPSTMGFYGILFKCFDKSLWRSGSIRWTRLLKVPVLAGEWHGHILSSFDNHKKPHEVTVRIKPVSACFAVTAASCTTAPVGSEMLPRMLAVISWADKLRHTNTTNKTQNNLPRQRISSLLRADLASILVKITWTPRAQSSR